MNKDFVRTSQRTQWVSLRLVGEYFMGKYFLFIVRMMQAHKYITWTKFIFLVLNLVVHILTNGI
jgi:hypothetical protein